jgi:hypothetical protein
MDGVRFATVGGADFPVACLVRQTRRYSDGNVQRTWAECARSNVDLAPDFAAAGAFVPRLRDGTALTNLDDRKKPLVWRRGGPAPYDAARPPRRGD